MESEERDILPVPRTVAPESHVLTEISTEEVLTGTVTIYSYVVRENVLSSVPSDTVMEESQLLLVAFLSSFAGAAAASSGMFWYTGMSKVKTELSITPESVYAFFKLDASSVGAFTLDIY